MTAINAVTDYVLEGDVGVITLNSPPVNALSAAVRDGLAGGMAMGIADAGARAIVLICEGRTFIAGADITEFGGAQKGASLFDVQDAMEGSPKPVIAAIHGTALGGGLETALACHYRVAVPSARCGLPEVALGLLPGAGGTQRLPRIVGPQRALEMVTSGQHVPAKACLEMGLVDEIVEEGKLREGAIAFAHKVVAEGRPLKKVRDSDDKVEARARSPGNIRRLPQGERPQVPWRPGAGVQHPLHRGGGEPAVRRGAEDRARPVHGADDGSAERRPALRLLRRTPGQ